MYGFDKRPQQCMDMIKQVSPETWAVAIADTSQWYVDTSDLNEMGVIKVSVGQKVDISADALQGVKMSGAV